ncbi:hypothetical protein IV203_014537 [Nitzschia inconspicua]|uniref:Uncharacterized protein n=1 Tax=Nitzschia inconspicua TaxID=303405 RepID=A0A9K3L8V3_9STRA|nr:hypothetical protein IV203_014508 [Nitzschia inconspicua]KAG7357950.1 hypothetical protein IV203_014537 [Nitzschia inconspicua]
MREWTSSRNNRKSWLSMQEDKNTLVTQCKQLHDLTWVQKKVAVKGVPLPEIGWTVVAELHGRNMDQEPIFEVGTNEDQEPIFEVECHIPDTIHNLQVSPQNAVTSLRNICLQLSSYQKKMEECGGQGVSTCDKTETGLKGSHLEFNA